MKTFCYTLAFAALLGLSSSAFASTVETGRDRNVDDQDIRALKEWIDLKRQVSLKEVGGDLSISGEVRTEFQSAWETVNGKKQRGINDRRRVPSQGFDIEVNLMFDYRNDRTWASVKLEFDNDAGIFSGTNNKIALERAYWAVRVVEGDALNFDIEVGRRYMSAIYDSKIQFGSFYDGIVFRYDHAFEKIGDFYIHAGPFIVNDRKNHFAYVGEIGLLNIAGTGFYTKFSLVDWDTKHYKKDFVNDRFNFIIAQFTPSYRFKIKCLNNKLAVIYSAVLCNFAAKKLPVSDFKRANWGGYIGFSIGQLLRQWDWACDVNYQVVGAQAVPDFDASGIGLGNASRSGFYTKEVRTLEGGGPSTPKTAGGTTNYRGFLIAFDLLLTDKLDMQQSYVQSITLDSSIGPFRRYKQYEIEFIYSW